MSDVFGFVAPGGLPGPVVFPPTSRYAATPVLAAVLDGEDVRYLDIRLLPPLEAFAVLTEHVVVEGERPDTVAARYVGDAEQWWQLCDANLVLHPAELTATVGRRIRITLPRGIPGGTVA